MRIFTPEGRTLMALGTEGEKGAPGMPFHSPTNATIAVSGDLYVSDGYEQNRCHCFSSAGEIKRSWGSGDAVYYQMAVQGEITGKVGDGPGEFNLPHGIVTDSSGRVYVIDRENGRVQVFMADGEYITEWDDVPGGNDAVIDGEGVMHVATGHGPIILKRQDGETVGMWGERGEEEGRFSGGTCTWRRLGRSWRWTSLRGCEGTSPVGRVGGITLEGNHRRGRGGRRGGKRVLPSPQPPYRSTGQSLRGMTGYAVIKCIILHPPPTPLVTTLHLVLFSWREVRELPLCPIQFITSIHSRMKILVNPLTVECSFVRVHWVTSTVESHTASATLRFAITAAT